MKTSLVNARILRITDIESERLDPITVVLEDVGPRRGRLTITCFNGSWCAFWGGMGDRPVREFVRKCDVEYLVGCLARGARQTRAKDDYVRRIVAVVLAALKDPETEKLLAGPS